MEAPMAIERTLSIIKPDGTERNLIGKILQIYEGAGLKVVAAKLIHLSEQEAGQFYAVHKERPFYGELVEFMTRNPVFVSVLEGENAVAKHRELMGATNPAEAAEGTVGNSYADPSGENTSPAPAHKETAKEQMKSFFPDHQING